MSVSVRTVPVRERPRYRAVCDTCGWHGDRLVQENAERQAVAHVEAHIELAESLDQRGEA